MAEENAPPPAGGEGDTAKKKLRLKVTRVEEDKPRVRRRILAPKPAAEPGTGEGAPPTEARRVGAGRILEDLARKAWGVAKGWNRNVLLGITAVLGVMILYGLWSEWRKTVVRVKAELNEVRLGDKPEVLVLYDFSERLAGLRRDYGRRLAPLQPQIREIEKTLILAKADAAGTTEKMRMMEQAFGEEKTKSLKSVEENQASVRRLWIEEAGLLDQEFDDRLKEFLEKVEARARDLGLFYHPEEDEDLQQAEIVANEFRLALYRAPPSIRLPEQFAWIEKELKEWHRFEKDWKSRYQGLGGKARKLRNPGGDNPEQRQDQLKIQARELDKFRGDAQTIRKEIEEYEARLRDLREKQALAKGPFEEDVNTIPDSFLCERIPLEEGLAQITVEGKVAEAPQGALRIVLRGKRNGQPAWAIRPLDPVPHKKTEVIFRDEDFREIIDWLETE